MKKQILAIASSAVLVLSLASCGKDKDTVKISLPEGQEYLTLGIGVETTIDVNVPEGESVTWSCKDDSIASISPDGKLSGRSNGITVVTAQTASGYDHVGVVVGNGVSGSTGSSTDTDNNTQSPATTTFTGTSGITNISLTLNGMTGDETLIMSNGDSPTFKVNITPSGCTDPITFTSSNTGVATVDSNGKVTPVSPGKTTITASAVNGTAKATFTVFVSR